MPPYVTSLVVYIYIDGDCSITYCAPALLSCAGRRD
jgi:hypothetical protein